MSILVNRLATHIDNATRDPEAEKVAKEEQAKIKILVKDYKLIYTAAKEKLVIAKKDQQLNYSEIKSLTDLNESRKTLLDNTSEYTEDEFKDKWDSITENYDILTKLAFGPRSLVFNILNVCKQCLHDNPNMKNNIITYLNNQKDKIINFLDENKYTESEAIYNSEIDTLNKDFQKEGDSDKEFGKLWQAAQSKIKKNNGYLDFQEKHGAPVPYEIEQNKKAEHEANVEAERDNFSIGRFFSKMFKYAITIFLILFILFVVGLGGSFAVNLNVYKPIPYKILYAIYGILFSFIVIPYTLLYRWAYLGKKPQFYSFMPMIPRFFVYRPTQFLLGWLTYKPDAKMWDLQEWRKPLNPL